MSVPSPDTAALPRRRRSTPRPAANQAALQSACLSATLATAFGAAVAPAHAELTTTNNTEIFDGQYLTTDGEHYFTTPIDGSRTSSNALGEKGIVVFTDSPDSYIGQDFKTLFGVNESDVLAYLLDPTTGDVSAYNTFVSNVPESFYVNSTYSFNSPITAYGVLFSAGKDAGTLDLQYQKQVNDQNFGLFGVGVEPTAPPFTTPEPNVAALLLSGMAVLGTGLLRRRRAARA